MSPTQFPRISPKSPRRVTQVDAPPANQERFIYNNLKLVSRIVIACSLT